MSAHPVQVTPQPPSHTLDVRNNFRGAKMMHNPPPVFSPDNSPPLTGSSSRKHYLPLVSPVLTEDVDRPFDFSRRRGSTPSLQKSSASQYFEDLRKRRRGSESQNHVAESTSSDKQGSIYMQQKSGESPSTRFAELPTALAQTIVRALEDQARATSLKKKTMSLPSSAPAFGLNDGTTAAAEDEEERQRRASMRSRQLALLASQARLARTGSSSVQTALVAERAVKGAIQEVVEDLQVSKISKNKAIKMEELEEAEVNGSNSEASKEVTPISDKSERSESSEKTPEEGDKVVNTVVAPSEMWSQALSSPQAVTAFLASAGEVAHDWANGFYKFEGEWAGDALRKEQMKLSESQLARKRQREGEDDASGATVNGDQSPPKAQASRLSPPEIALKEASTSPDSRDQSPTCQSIETIPLSKKVTIAVPPSLPTSSARSSLMAAQKRLSMSLPVVPVTKPSPSAQEGGQLVDVLSNFVSLIEQRKETCHGLEKLALDARRLSTVQLPTISSAMANRQKIDEERSASEMDEDSSDATTMC